MTTNKYYLSGGYTFEVTFEMLENGKIKVVHVYDNRNDAEEVMYTTESEISEIVGKEWYHGIPELTSYQVGLIVSRLHDLKKEIEYEQ